MALLTTANSTNRVVDTALRVVYARRRIYGAWTYVTGNQTVTYTSAWEYTRVATKTYKYVGMTAATANSVVSALTSLYTRTTKVSEWDTTEGSATFGQFKVVNAGNVPMADIVAQHEDGEMWSAVCSVNEADSRISLSPNESFTSLFATENSRDYDTSSSGPLT